MQRFTNDEAGFQNWCREHPRGYVLNQVGNSSAEMVTIHKAACRHLAGARPGTERICSGDLFELEKIAADLGGLYWRHCRACLNKPRRSVCGW